MIRSFLVLSFYKECAILLQRIIILQAVIYFTLTVLLPDLFPALSWQYTLILVPFLNVAVATLNLPELLLAVVLYVLEPITIYTVEPFSAVPDTFLELVK